MSNRLGLAAVVAASVIASACAAGCAATSEPPEELGETEGHLLAGRVLGASEVAGHLRAAGFPKDQIGRMTCVAKYESSFFERATNGSHYGLWQIAALHLGQTQGCPSSKEQLFDAAANARCALGVFRAQGLGAWSAYKSHKGTCDHFAAPAGSTASTTSTTSATSAAAGGDDDDDGTSAPPVPPEKPTPPPDAATAASSTSAADPGADTSASDAVGGGCWSNTLDDMVDPLVCVQSSGSNVWFQCKQGQWYRGVTGSSGPFGPCADTFPL